MAPILDGTASEYGHYQPSLIERIEDFCAARWPFLAAALLTLALLGASHV